MDANVQQINGISKYFAPDFLFIKLSAPSATAPPPAFTEQIPREMILSCHHRDRIYIPEHEASLTKQRIKRIYRIIVTSFYFVHCFL